MFYNKLLITKDSSFNTAFNTFKDNIDLDSSITKHIDVLDANYPHIPYEFRDADLTMIGGAYGEGKICAYDSVGNIVDLGFSRAGRGINIIENSTTYEVAEEDVPLITKKGWYSLEEDISIVQTFPSLTNWVSNASTYSVINNEVHLSSIATSAFHRRQREQGLHVVRDGTFSRFWFLFRAGNNSLDRSLLFLIRSPGTSGVRVYEEFTGDAIFKMSLATGEFLPISNNIHLQVKNYKLVDLGNNEFYVEFSLKKLNSPVSNSYISTVAIGLHDQVTTSASYVETDATKSVIITGMGGNVNNSEANYINGELGYNPISIPTVTPITLTSNAVIFIKTAKGAKLLTLPSGSFNIHDYISNDKLICLTIKYI